MPKKKTEPLEILVIGYGNELRCDDAAGPVAAHEIESLRLPHVSVLALPQLTPELSEPISQADLVVFIDASSSPALADMSVQTVQPAVSAHAGTHVSSPDKLLSLSETLFGRAPKAVLLELPVSDLSIGEKLSPKAEEAVQRAVHYVVSLAVPEKKR